MPKQILNKNQIELLPLIKTFKREFYMVGGTAVALYIGHRRSIDFDLFKSTKLNQKKILQKLNEFSNKCIVTRNVEEQLNVVVNDVKLTFFEFPFPIETADNFENYAKIPNLLTLAAMKAYALGRRSKWKDYVDLYFMIKKYYSIEEISTKAVQIFGDLFSEKLFRAQLCYYNDIDYTEKVDFIQGFETEQNLVKTFLTTTSLKFDE